MPTAGVRSTCVCPKNCPPLHIFLLGGLAELEWWSSREDSCEAGVKQGRLQQAQQPGCGGTISPGIQEGPVSSEAVYHRGLISPMADICLLSWAMSWACLS